MNILKTLFGTDQYVSKTDTTADSRDADSNDIWAFTNPDAREQYEKSEQLAKLEHYIRYEVMRGEPWRREELDYKIEIRRMLREGAIADKGSYWYSSPFPTVYRAKRSGSLTVDGREFRFEQGDDIVFQCRMEQERSRDPTGPALITQLKTTDKVQLCGDMGGPMKGMSEI